MFETVNILAASLSDYVRQEARVVKIFQIYEKSRLLMQGDNVIISDYFRQDARG